MKLDGNKAFAMGVADAQRLFHKVARTLKIVWLHSTQIDPEACVREH